MKLSRRSLLIALAAISAGTSTYALAEELGDPFEHDPKGGDDDGLVPLIYSSHYDITAFGIEKLHPFDGRKFSGIHKSLLETGLRKKNQFISPEALTTEQLLQVHTKRYLKSLKHSVELAKILEVAPLAVMPASLLDWRILKPMRLSSGGTLLTCRMALKHGLAINIGGGFHHAESDQGGGFCVYCDVPIAFSVLRKEGLLKRAMIVDTDAHQGNGFSNVLREESSSYVLDLFDESIYPWPKVKEHWSIAFPAKTGGEKYLSTLKEALPKAIAEFKPDLIAYNAGSDVLESDPLSSFKLSIKDMNERDVFVVSTARKMNIPIAMVLAGGYSHESREAHSKSIEAIVREFDKHS